MVNPAQYFSKANINSLLQFSPSYELLPLEDLSGISFPSVKV